MPDGNRAALREFEAKQARAELGSPTESELESYVQDRLETQRDKLGTEFVREPIAEASEAELIELFQAFRSGDSAEIGARFKAMVEKYWEPAIREAANYHDFSEDRKPDEISDTEWHA